MDELVEKLAELEHDQWIFWSKAVAKHVPDKVSQKWEYSWVPYAELSEDLKEQDRIWARKAVKIFKENA
jgi:hypothetical protein